MSLKKPLNILQKFVYNYNLTRYDNNIVSYPKWKNVADIILLF